jgi:hypothetical protein
VEDDVHLVRLARAEAEAIEIVPVLAHDAWIASVVFLKVLDDVIAFFVAWDRHAQKPAPGHTRLKQMFRIPLYSAPLYTKNRFSSVRVIFKT